MRTIIVLLLATAVFAVSSEDVMNTIKKIDQTKFGRTLLDTVQLQLQTNDPLDTLLETLTQLEDQLVAEQKVEDAQNSEFQGACNYDIAALDKDLAESNTYRVQLEARLEGQLYPTKQILEGIVASKERELAGYNKEVDNLDANRSEEKVEFEQKVREHDEATAVITEVRRVFVENLEAPEGEVVFLQGRKINSKAFVTMKTTTQITKHLQIAAKKAAKNVHRKAYAKLYKVLATISSNAHQLANQGSVGRIVDLIDELLGKVQDSLDLERSAEDKRVAAYVKARRLLGVTIGITQTVLVNTQTDLASVEDQITLAETALENTIQRIDNKSEERSDRHSQCEQAALDYQNSRVTRDADRNVISQTVGIVNTNLRTLREQLALRLSAGDSIDY